MSDQIAQHDGNHIPALIAHSDTGNQAETRKVVASDGNLHVLTLSSMVPGNFDYIDAGYPDGTTETYTYKNGGATGVTVSTLTITYTDSSKGSISAVSKA